MIYFEGPPRKTWRPFKRAHAKHLLRDTSTNDGKRQSARDGGASWCAHGIRLVLHAPGRRVCVPRDRGPLTIRVCTQRGVGGTIVFHGHDAADVRRFHA